MKQSDKVLTKETLDENLCILGVPYIGAGAEAEKLETKKLF